MKEKIRKLVSPLYNLVSPLYNKVWHSPKGKIRERIRKACDDLPRNQRLMVVSVLLSAFVLVAFFVFGNACYKMGAGYARKSIEIEHIKSMPLPDEPYQDSITVIKAYEEIDSMIEMELPTEKSIDYEDAR